MEIVKHPEPPTGLARVLFRLPITFYRLRLGWLLGGRFLLLTHTGRVSGKQRQVVIEVIGDGGVPGSYVCCSGFGKTAAWYRNITATPEVTIQVGARRWRAMTERLDTEAGPKIMADYAERHPKAARKLSRFMGFEVDGSAGDYREVGRHLPFVRFTPTD